MTTFPEPLVARVTGIAKKIVATARRDSPDIAKGPDWFLENSSVVYTADGLKKICAALRVDPAALQWPAPAASAVPLSDAAPGEIDPATANGGPSAHALAASAAPEKISAAVSPDAAAQFAPGAPPAVNAPFVELEQQLATAKVADGVEQLAAAAELVEVIVVRTSANPRVIYGRIAARPVIVGVRENKNFIPGMKLQAHHAGGDYFRQYGNCPRWPGRW